MLVFVKSIKERLVTDEYLLAQKLLRKHKRVKLRPCRLYLLRLNIWVVDGCKLPGFPVMELFLKFEKFIKIRIFMLAGRQEPRIALMIQQRGPYGLLPRLFDVHRLGALVNDGPLVAAPPAAVGVL